VILGDVAPTLVSSTAWHWHALVLRDIADFVARALGVERVCTTVRDGHVGTSHGRIAGIGGAGIVIVALGDGLTELRSRLQQILRSRSTIKCGDVGATTDRERHDHRQHEAELGTETFHSSS